MSLCSCADGWHPRQLARAADGAHCQPLGCQLTGSRLPHTTQHPHWRRRQGGRVRQGPVLWRAGAAGEQAAVRAWQRCIGGPAGSCREASHPPSLPRSPACPLSTAAPPRWWRRPATPRCWPARAPTSTTTWAAWARSATCGALRRCARCPCWRRSPPSSACSCALRLPSRACPRGSR